MQQIFNLVIPGKNQNLKQRKRKEKLSFWKITHAEIIGDQVARLKKKWTWDWGCKFSKAEFAAKFIPQRNKCD